MNYKDATVEELEKALAAAKWHCAECLNDPLGIDMMALAPSRQEARNIYDELVRRGARVPEV